jgi:hypothetical protein
MKIPYCFLFFIVIFSSCDTFQAITFDNRTKGNVAIRYFKFENQDSVSIVEIRLPKQNDLSIPSGFRQYGTDEEIKEYLKLKNDPLKQNVHTIPLGINQYWTDEKIRAYIKNIQRIEIATSQKTIILEEEELFKYLKKRRNFFKNRIIIKIEK